jgi:site-specific DNA-methyltransferase (adenine-specific)
MKYPNDFINKIICGDCLEVMKNIPDKSVDLVIADSPYNISKKNNFATMERYNQYKGMDFGEWDKNFNQISWIETTIRIMKNPSSIIIFNSWQNLKLISDELEKFGLSTKRILVIRKTNPMPINRDRLFTNSFEFCLWATKGSHWTFNREGHFETGYFECKNNGVTKHPTEKNINVIKKIIKVLSNKNDVIIDPFLGSGTTAVACKSLGRRYIGIEISPKYCEIAKARVNATPEPLF